MEFGSAFDLPISPKIVKPISVRSITDAIVELVTNSDDGYNRPHESTNREGQIEIYVERIKGGKCKKLVVKDFAEGMSREQLQKAITFGEEASGFEIGRSVRGLFGRGLKEAILALGEGEINTIHDGVLDGARIWLDPNRRSKCSLLRSPLPATDEIRKEVGIEQGNGTKITISVTNEEMVCPDYKTLKRQVRNHYTLRDINMSEQRKVILTLQSGADRSSIPISYSPPEGKIVWDETVNLPGFGDNISIRVWESSAELETPRHNPFGEAGLLIKTKGAILDNQLFRYENEGAACYYFGEIFCEGIAERVRAGDFGLIDPARAGLNWRRHAFCQALQSEIESTLAPLIDKKKGELEAKPPTEVLPRTKKMLYDMCRLLNRLANRELAELSSTDGEGDEKLDEKIHELIIKPDTANIQPNTPRVFSIYAPQDILGQSAVRNEVKVESDNPNIQVLDPTVTLRPHPDPEYSYLHYGRFRVVGSVWKEEAWITCTLGNHEAVALARVAPPGKRPPKGKLKGPKGGFFSGIVPDESENPMQRVFYAADTGKVLIYIRFPVVAKYLGPGLKGSESPEGGAMLAELVGEAFCKAMARKAIDAGKYFNEIEGFNAAVNDFQRKCLHQIHAIMKR